MDTLSVVEISIFANLNNFKQRRQGIRGTVSNGTTTLCSFTDCKSAGSPEA
jgi:hypothetical protein